MLISRANSMNVNTAVLETFVSLTKKRQSNVKLCVVFYTELLEVNITFC